jgi:hypothetical protein
MVASNASAVGRRRDANPPMTARRRAPSRTYSEQVARLFGTERDGDGDDSHDLSSSSDANADFDEDNNNNNNNNNNNVVDPRTTDPRVPNPALSSAAVGSTASSSSPANSNNRRSSAPTYASASSSSAAQQQPQQPHRHSADAGTAAVPSRPPRPMPTNLLLRPVATSSSTDATSGGSKSQASTGRWKMGMKMMAGMAMVVAMAGLGWGAYRHARGQLQHELVAAMELHHALELEMAKLQNEADRQLKHRSDQLRLEENLQQLNAELDDTERALQTERDKLSQRQDELERLVRAEQQQTSTTLAGNVETGGHDGVYAPFDVTSPLMMGMGTSLQQQQQHPLQAGGGDIDTTANSEDSLVGRLVQNLGVEQYGLRPRHVELHLEYHRRHPTTKRTSIHRRYILAQLSLMQRPITAFVFLQQVEHDLYDHVKLQIVKDDTDTDEDEEGEVEMALHTQLTDRQRRQRSAMGLAHVPVQEAGASTYRNPLLLAMDENGTDTTASSAAQATEAEQQEPRHYHLALTDDGDLVISTALHRPGVFATVVHGDPVLDKLLLASSPSEEAESKKGHHHPANEMHVELISIRLLSTLDDGEEDPGHSGEEDENEKEADDDNDEDEEKEEEEELDRHDEH